MFTGRYECLVLGQSKDRKLCDILISPEHGPRKLLDAISCFHHVSKLTSPFSEHVGYVCSCPDGWKHGVCKHAIAMTILTDANFILPAYLDERPLDKYDNARKAAKAFAVGERQKLP